MVQGQTERQAQKIGPGGSLDAESLPLSNDWHSVVFGVRPHDWVGAWVDSVAPRVVHGVQHSVDFVQVLILGKGDGNWSGRAPSGTVFFDDVTLLFATHSADRPIRFEASGGPHTTRILGSESAASVAWTRLTNPSEITLAPDVDLAKAAIWKADVSAWGLKRAPRFVGTRSADGLFTRLPLARELYEQVYL